MPRLTICDKFGVALESSEIDCSLSDWLSQYVPSLTDEKLFSATLNGLPFTDFDRALSNNDEILLTIEPGDPLVTVLVIVSVLSAGYSYYTAKKLQDQYQESASKGKSIYAAGARANSATPSGIIREIAGRVNIYPDLICPPTKRFINNEEFLYLMLSVCRGNIDLQEKNIYVSETPAINYESDITIDIFEPGADVSASLAHENWYQSREVSGLKLVTATDIQVGVWTLDASGAQFTSYLDAVATAFPFQVNEVFEVVGGSNPGFYIVDSISGASSEIADVTEFKRAGGDTGRLEAAVQYVITNSRLDVRRTVFETVGIPTLTPVVGESFTSWEGINGGENWEGPFRVIPTNETTRYVEIDMFFPQGLTTLDGDNEDTNTTVDVAIQWRPIGGTTWTTVSGTSYTNATRDQIGVTELIDFGSSIEPEIRIRRITRDSEDISTSDIIEVSRIKSKLETPTSYSDITTVGVILRGTNALAQTAENKINIRGATKKLPTIDELESGVWDLSNSATQVSGGWTLANADFRATTQFTDIGDGNETTGTYFGFDFNSDGTKSVIIDNGVVKFYHCDTPFKPNLGIQYQGLLLAPGDKERSVKFADDGHIYILRKLSDPATDYYSTSVEVTLDPDPAIDVVIGTITQEIWGYGATFTEMVSNQVDEVGDRVWLADGPGQFIAQYSMSTPHSLTTSSYDSVLLDLSTDMGAVDIRGFHFADYNVSDQPTRLYVLGADGFIKHYVIGTPGDITTAVNQNDDFDSGLGGECKEITVSQTTLAISTTDDVTGFVKQFNLQEIADMRASRSIARYVGFMLRDSLGDTASSIVDWDELDTLDTLLTSRGDTLDAEFVDETTLWEAIRISLNAGMSEPTIKEGLFTPIRLGDTSEYLHLYTPDVMTDEGVQIDHVHSDDQEPDGIDVEYFDIDSNRMEVVRARLSGDLGIKPKRMQLVGVTDNTRAWRIGMRERRRFRFKPATYTFTTEMDALNSSYGDYIAVASDVFAGEFGEVIGYSAPDVTLDFEPALAAGTNFAAFRNNEGRTSGLYTVVAGPSANQITLSSPTTLDFTPILDDSMDATMMSVGPADEWGVRAIITDITPSGENSVTITAEEYLLEIYEDDDNAPS